MRLDKGGSRDPIMTAGRGYGPRLLDMGSPVAASPATAGMREWGSRAAGAAAANRGDAGLAEAGSAAAAAAAASRKSVGLDRAGSAADTGPAANRREAGLDGAGLAADTIPSANQGDAGPDSAAAATAAANRGDAGLDEAGSAAAAAAAARRKSAGLGGAGLAAGTVPAACPEDPGLDGIGWAAASAAAATWKDAGLDDAGSAAVTAVDQGEEGIQLEVVAPRPQLLVVEPLIGAVCAPPTNTGKMARTRHDRHRCPECVGTYGRTAADRAGLPFLRADAGRKEPCCRNGRSSHSPTPCGQRVKGDRLCAERPPQRSGTPPFAAPSSENGRVPAAGTEKDGRRKKRARAHGAATAANDNGGREKVRGHAHPPLRDATRPPTTTSAVLPSRFFGYFQAI